MKLISLNIWGGKMHDALLEYIKENSDATDIFCFQEVFKSNAGIEESRGTCTNILADIKTALPEHKLFLAPIGSGYDMKGPVNFDITESQATFVKKHSGYKVADHGSVFLHGEYKRLREGEAIEDIPNNLQYVRLTAGSKAVTIANVHGMSRPGDKLDTPKRIAQSKTITDFLGGESGAKILCGDFNLLPHTESIAMIERVGMVNLIKKFNVSLTRSRLSPFYGKPDFQKFADYAFVSPDVRVLAFSVPEIEVSDHLPLVLEFM